jgi:hypothetical protein
MIISLIIIALLHIFSLIWKQVWSFNSRHKQTTNTTKQNNIQENINTISMKLNKIIIKY